MIQYFFIILLLIGTPSCSNSHMITPACMKNYKKPSLDIIECQSFVICIRNCGDLLQHTERLKDIFKDACKSAHFENTDIVTEDYSSPITTYIIKASKGYATLSIDTIWGSCILEFCCENESYNYADFVSAFMIPIHELQEENSFDEVIRTFEDFLIGE